MLTIDFLKSFLQETAALRLGKICRDSEVRVNANGISLRTDGSYGERLSSIMLWGAPGRITIKTHFDLDTAVAFAARGFEKTEDEIEDMVATDYMREFSNLHAGYLRGLFESKGILFGMSLPFIMAGDSEATLQEIQGAGVETAAWTLTSGEQVLTMTVQIEILDLAAIERLRPELEAALKAETQKDVADDGEVEFLL